MTDRELTEAAAKAMGIAVTWEPAHSCYWIDLGQGLPIDEWNPLHDRVQNFALAAKLRLSIVHETQRIDGKDIEIVEVIGPEYEEWKRHCEMHSLDDNPEAAIMRCVVRAAAALAVSDLSKMEGAK